MEVLPDPKVLLDVLRQKIDDTQQSRDVDASEYIQLVGHDCYQRILDLGDFDEVSKQIGGTLSNALITIALSYELEQRNRFERAYMFHKGEVYDGAFLRAIDPDRAPWPQAVVDELRLYHNVSDFFDKCLRLARSVADPVDGDAVAS